MQGDYLFRRSAMAVGLALGLAWPANGSAQEFTTDFGIEECTFSTESDNPYFFLEAGLQYVLEGTEEGDEGEQVAIRVALPRNWLIFSQKSSQTHFQSI